jgi:hypothetical protein
VLGEIRVPSENGIFYTMRGSMSKLVTEGVPCGGSLGPSKTRHLHRTENTGTAAV